MPILNRPTDSFGNRQTINSDSNNSFGFKTPERLQAIRSIIIERSDLKFELLDDFVTGLYVEENASGLDVAQINFHNLNTSLLTNQEIWRPQNIVRIFTGYSDSKLELRGKFRIHRPRYCYKGGQAETLELFCVSEEYDLMHTERRHVYLNKRDSDIVAEIAARNSLRFDIEPTTVINRQVNQVNESDMKFIEKRSKLYGYDFYIENGILHFHTPRYNHSGLVVYYRDGERSFLREFNVEIDSFYHGEEYQATKFNPLTKENYDVTTNESQDTLNKNLKNRNQSVDPSDFSTIKGEKPKRFLIHEGQWQTRFEAQKQVNTFAQNSQYALKGDACSDFGVEDLHARQVITILGVGRFSGDYYVTKVCHKLYDSYKMYFDVTRVAHGTLIDRPISGTVRGVATLPDSQRANLTNGGALRLF